jgi:hypothetical protein
MNKNDYQSIAYFLLFSALIGLVVLPVTNVSAASPVRNYAGYYYYNDSQMAPDGVQAKIKTVNTGLPPLFESISEWDTIVISYSLHYWVQLGYTIHWKMFFFIPYVSVDFYKEKKDSSGSETVCIGTPTFNTVYKYELLLTGVGEFSYHIYQGYTTILSGKLYVNQYTTRDLQAFIETSHTGINIDGSHFPCLRYHDSGTSWRLWNRHEGYVDPPYSLNEIYDFEFTASGGG